MINALKLAILGVVIVMSLSCDTFNAFTANRHTPAAVSKFDVALAKDVEPSTEALVTGTPGTNEVRALTAAADTAEAGVWHTEAMDLEVWLNSASSDYATYFETTGVVKTSFKVDWDGYAAGATDSLKVNSITSAKEIAIRPSKTEVDSRATVRVGEELLQDAKTVVIALRVYHKVTPEADVRAKNGMLREWTLTLKAPKFTAASLSGKKVKVKVQFFQTPEALESHNPLDETGYTSVEIGSFNSEGVIAAAATPFKTGAGNVVSSIRAIEIWDTAKIEKNHAKRHSYGSSSERS